MDIISIILISVLVLLTFSCLKGMFHKGGGGCCTPSFEKDPNKMKKEITTKGSETQSSRAEEMQKLQA